MNQKRLEFTGVRPIKDIWLTDFFGDDRLWVSSVIAAARSAGCASLKSTCGLVNPGGGDGGSSTMVAWPAAWASWLELVVAVGVSVACAVGAVVFLGGMVKNETVSSRRVEVSVRIYCYAVISGANDGVTKSDGGDVGGTWLQLMCCALPKCLCP